MFLIFNKYILISFKYKYDYNIAYPPSNTFDELESKKDEDDMDIYKQWGG